MNSLAFDPGSLFSGWSLFVNGEPVLNSNIKIKSKLPLSKRLGILFTEANSLVQDIKPDIIVVEEQHVGKNKKTSLVTARAMGVIIAVAGINDIPVVSYEPCEIKKAVTGKGNAPKEEVAEEIISLYPKSECIKEIGAFKDKGVNKNDDIYDAVGINYTHKVLNKSVAL